MLTPEGSSKLVHVQKDPKSGAVTSTIVREIVGEQMVQTLSAGSVVCKRIYKRTA